jgi:formate dehydrogenase subunit delta
MDTANLVHMANRIGEFFASMPDRDQAREGIAHHLAQFWAPPMRRSLLAYLDSSGAPDLLPLAREALELHRHQL